MNADKSIVLEQIMPPRMGSVDPSAFPHEDFDLYSIPAFDHGEPEVLEGSQIGSSKQVVQPGDVLLSRIVPHIRRAWVVGHNRGRRIIASGEWIVFRGEAVDPGYLRHVLVSDPFHAEFMRTVSGVGGSLLRARAAYVAKIHIPFPSLPEQRWIAEILDNADALRTKRRATLAQLDMLIQSIFLDMFGDPSANPRKWPQESLETFFHFTTGKLDSNAAVALGQYPFFTCSREDSRIDTFAFDCEALLLAGNNATADYSVKHYKGKFNAYQRTYVITLRDEHNSYEYSRFVLENRLAELKRLSKGTGTKYLTLELLNRIRIPVPPQELQGEFARHVGAVEKVKESQRACLAELNSLFVSLQHRVFRGELALERLLANTV